MYTFMHNGKEVRFQEFKNARFLSILNDMAIIPSELPELSMSYRVFKYRHNGVDTYACVVGDLTFGSESVYITESYPDDGFWNLMVDVMGQLKGDKPEEARSRLGMVLDEAVNGALKSINELHKEKKYTFLSMPNDIMDECVKMIKNTLVMYGYDLQTIDMISAPDVDMEKVRRILQ